MFSSIGFPELLVILLIALLLFGSRLPQVGKALGEGIRNFKKGLDGAQNSESASVNPSKPAQHERIAAQPVDPHQLSEAAQRQRDANHTKNAQRIVDVEHQNS